KQKKALTRVAVESSDDQITLIARTADGRLVMAYLQKEESLLSLGDETEDYQAATVALPPVESANHILIDSEQRTVYVATATGGINVVDIADKDNPVYVERVVVTKNDSLISSLRFLAGGISLLVGTTDGKVSQWFPVRKDNNVSLTYIRSFKSQDGVLEDIAPEQRRKGFVTANNKGVVHVFHATANRDVANQKISDKPLTHIAISPRADMLIAQDQDKQLQVWKVHNEHPEISWSVLWEKIWYESYPEPDYTWQSSSASNDFEPKFSLMPLAFGTLKAAFYAMLFAVPLSIMGAIYTAYFMSPAMRAYVKPSIEIMEALPTVILGFLAGLWLAPAVEANLPGIFTLLILLPPGVLACAWGWKRLSKHIKWHVPDGWQAAMLIPAILFIGWLAMVLSSPLEALLFRGDMKLWLSNELGLTYDQRNSLVVGLAMGVAVIPTIFSIAEDAIFSVPRHLTLGSLALGATPWQTLVRVVMLTASPGIFSAVMIGLGRAVGETMIVLMATGNTPVMDFSIFQGMRTLSANIAVEMPESEVNSSHYRVLFLAALVLFMFTFLFNTAAELIRQRLRQKYSSL
ncbi:MAG: ABC transporter permease subunit, partial [Gammaproteobacteria bacterium]|nr:ABC transporter permease subunit [Gammaproteobacteria bacterium]